MCICGVPRSCCVEGDLVKALAIDKTGTGRVARRMREIGRHTRLESPSPVGSIFHPIHAGVIDEERTLDFVSSFGEFVGRNVVILRSGIDTRNKLLDKASVVAAWKLGLKRGFQMYTVAQRCTSACA